jgi:hypothetical protein
MEKSGTVIRGADGELYFLPNSVLQAHKLSQADADKIAGIRTKKLGVTDTAVSGERDRGVALSKTHRNNRTPLPDAPCRVLGTEAQTLDSCTVGAQSVSLFYLN